MKKLLFAVLFIVGNSINSNAQIWKFTSGGNDFDGRYKTSSIKGSASNYPYNNPRLVINYFDKDDSLNFYIINAGYYSDSSDVKVLWVFNNEKDIIYETPLINLSSDGKSIFFEEFKSPKSGEYLSVYEFIDKLKKATNVSVRVKGQFDKNDIKFSLKGSTKAINYVIPAEKMKSQINVIKLARRRKDSIKIIQKNIKSKLRKISDIENLTLKKIDRENMIGEKIKFLLKSGKEEYGGFGRTKSAYPYLKYNEFKGRIAKIIDLKKIGQSIVKYIYTLELEDNKEIVYMTVNDYEAFPDNIGYISLLNKAKERYLGKTFYSPTYFRLYEFENLQDCKIIKITFAEEDVKYAQLYGAFNVYFETKGYFNDTDEEYYEKKDSKMVNVKFTNTYAPVDGYKYQSDRENVFENVFYSAEEFAKPKEEEVKKVVIKTEKPQVQKTQEVEKVYIITTIDGEVITAKNYRANKKTRNTDIQTIDGKLLRFKSSKIISIKISDE